MRITRSTLHKIAKDTVAQRVKTDHNVMAALLVGSTLFEDPFIGHTTDIDIVFVCFNEPDAARQIVKLTNEVSLDLYFVESALFEPPRKLRTDPLLGYVMYNSLPLFETQHFFEYTQAIVRAGFDDTANVLARARKHSLPRPRIVDGTDPRRKFPPGGRAQVSQGGVSRGQCRRRPERTSADRPPLPAGV